MPRNGHPPPPPEMDANEYIKLAEVEDRMWYFRSLHRHVHRLLARGLISGLARAEAPILLDAGCGTGGLILRLRGWESQWRFTGLDFSSLACEIARQRLPGTSIVEGSITQLPFPDAAFDAIVSADVVCQVEDAHNAFSEFARCLRPGGTLVVNVPAYRWMWSYHDDTCQTKHRYVRNELLEHMRRAGLTPGFSTYWNCLPFPLLILKRKVFRTRQDTSDVRLYPAPLEAAFNGLMALEHAWVGNVARLPYGSSVLAAATKPSN